MTSYIKKLVFVSIFILLINFSQNTGSVAASYYDFPNLPYDSATINSRVIFSGFNPSIMYPIIGNPSFPQFRTPLERNVNNYFSQQYTEKTFFVNHTYELASTGFDSAFFTFLNDTAIADTINHSDGTSDTGRYISASETTGWLANNYENYFNNPPVLGYTLIIGNFSNLDDLQYPYHWYNETYYDPDSGEPVKRNYMIGYGSQERFYYLDLSADSYVLQDSEENSTIQDMSTLYNFQSEYGRERFADFLGDWIYEIERNLWVQDFVYSPLIPMGDLQTRLQFAMEILVLNNMTGISDDDLNWTVNTTLIYEVFKDILPSMNIEVSVRFVNLSDIPDLYNTVQSSLVHWGAFDKQSRWEYTVDIFPMYDQLYSNAYRYMEQDHKAFYTTHFQTFAFLFDNATFGIPEKAKMEPGLLGIALRDSSNRPMNIISHDFGITYGNNRSDPRPTQGLTQTIIHETGHQIALMHPFQYGIVGNFLDDPMTYYSHSTRFSIFSKDNIRRGQIDTLLQAGVAKMNQAENSITTKAYNSQLDSYLQSANTSFHNVLAKYNEMEYGEAYSLALAFYNQLISFDGNLESYPDVPTFSDIMPLFFIGMLVFLITTVYYQGKYRRLLENIPKRLLLTQPMVDRLEKVSIDTFVASRGKAREKITEVLEKDSSE